MRNRRDVMWASILILYGVVVLIALVGGGASRSMVTTTLAAIAAFVLMGTGLLLLATVRRRHNDSGAKPLLDPRRGFVVFIVPLVFLLLTAALPGPGFTPAFGGLPPPDLAGQISAGGVTSERPTLPLDGFALRLLEGEGPLVFNEANYFHLHDVLMTHPEMVAGREVRLDGFVARAGQADASEVMVGRYLLWCCGSDAVYLGMPLRGDLTGVADGSWIEVVGTLEVSITSVGGRLTPQPRVVVTATRDVAEPEFTYVLPF